MPTINVAAGCVSAPLAVSARSIVTVSPAAGATAVLEYTANSLADIQNGVAQWASWPKGASTSVQQDILNEPAFLRLTAISGAASVTTEESPTIMARESFNADWGGSKRYPFILAQSATPIILLSAATAISATGAITGLTALPYQPSGVVRVYCFAQAGLAAGLYYATFSSTSACQLYLDAAATVTPQGITPGAYASGTTAVNLVSVTVPGGSMGANGAVRHEANWGTSNSAGQKTLAANFGAQQLYGVPQTTIAAFRPNGVFRNRGSQSVQLVTGGTLQTAFTSTGTASSQTNVNTALDQAFTFTGQLAAAADFIILEGFTIEVLPG